MRNTLVSLTIAILAFPMFALAQQDDSILVDEYIISQEFVEAEVLKVNSQKRTLTVRGANRGQTREFSVPEGTRVTVNGRDARLRDIRRGDNVLLVMAPRAEEVVISRVRVPESPTSVEQRQADPVVAQATPSVLPKTASHWPTVLITGLMAFFGAGMLRAQRRSWKK